MSSVLYNYFQYVTYFIFYINVGNIETFHREVVYWFIWLNCTYKNCKIFHEMLYFRPSIN